MSYNCLMRSMATGNTYIAQVNQETSTYFTGRPLVPLGPHNPYLMGVLWRYSKDYWKLTHLEEL